MRGLLVAFALIVAAAGVGMLAVARPAKAAGVKASQVIVETSVGVFLYEPGGRNVWKWDGDSWTRTNAYILDR